MCWNILADTFANLKRAHKAGLLPAPYGFEWRRRVIIIVRVQCEELD